MPNHDPIFIVLGDLIHEWGNISTEPPKGTFLHGKTSYDVNCQNQSTGATCACDEEIKKRQRKNLTVENWVHA